MLPGSPEIQVFLRGGGSFLNGTPSTLTAKRVSVHFSPVCLHCLLPAFSCLKLLILG